MINISFGQTWLAATMPENTIQYLNDHNISFVSKPINPPNVPQARPIENFWSILADSVYSGGWEARNQQHLASPNQTTVEKKLTWKSSRPWWMMFAQSLEELKTEDLFRSYEYAILFILPHCIYRKKIREYSY